MTSALDLYRRRPARRESSRYSFDDWMADWASFSFGGNIYGPYRVPQTMPGTREPIESDFAGVVQGAYKSNGIVFACVLARMMLFSQARFMFQRFTNGAPGDLFTTGSLRVLERPEPNKTTAELLARAEQDVSLAGNFYATNRVPGQIRRLRPDWVTIVLGSFEESVGEAVDEVAWDLLGYIYTPGGKSGKGRPTIFMPDEVAHFSPIPDPIATHRGMSWLTPVLRNIEGHNAATTHKLKFFENGATPNLIVTFDPSVTLETFKAFKEAFDSEHRGASNAYKTVFMGGGADPKVVGNSFEQMAFKATQGADETVICAAAGVPPIIVGASEGLQAATYSNYGQARRKFGDHFAHPQWGAFAAAMETLVPPPDEASRLWFDDKHIAFLREDRKDEVDIQRTQSLSIQFLINAGYTPESVVDAVVSGDFRKLVHTGLFSVQLQPAGRQNSGPAPALNPADAD